MNMLDRMNETRKADALAPRAVAVAVAVGKADAGLPRQGNEIPGLSMSGIQAPMVGGILGSGLALPWDQGFVGPGFHGPGFHNPSFPGPSFPGMPRVPEPVNFWDHNSIQKEMERQALQRKEREKADELNRMMFEKFKWHDLGRSNSAEIEKRRKSDQARGFAEGVELSQGAVGARHQLRQALSAGHAEGMRRCWGAILERGFETDALGLGRSETLMAAALGAAPGDSLAFLAEVGFAPGAALASQAMLALLASSREAAGLVRLVQDFEAGSLSSSVITELGKISKGLGELVRSRGEAYELALVSSSAPTAGVGARRL